MASANSFIFSVLALSVIAARCQIPPFVAARHLPPARGKLALKVGALGSPRKVHLFAKASPFGRGGCDQWEQTERASPLAAVVAVAKQLGSIQKIQVAALEDFLCSAGFESLRDET